MELLQDRQLEGPNSTGARLWDVTGPQDGAVDLRWILEDTRRPGEPKVPGRTCIPTGRFRIRLRTEGGLHDKYRKRWSWHKGMLWLPDVPDFTWIQFHPGNTHEHTKGCPLNGERLVRDASNDLVIPGGESVSAYKRLCLHVYPELLADLPVWLTVTDHRLAL